MHVHGYEFVWCIFKCMQALHMRCMWWCDAYACMWCMFMSAYMWCMYIHVNRVDVYIQCSICACVHVCHACDGACIWYAWIYLYDAFACTNVMHMQLNSGSSTCSAHTALLYQIQRSGWYAFLMFTIYDQTPGNIVLTRVPPAFLCFFSVFSPPILPILPTFQLLPTLPITIGFSPVVLSEGQSKDMACQSFQCIVKSSRHFLIPSLGFFNKIL